jgi:ubiquinone/menaquinone biosynthesis C-methylase UbiE
LPESVSFDRAAGYYDRTRFLSEPVMARLVANVAAEIGHGAGCLEIGVGTGRFALPLARAGIRMSGVDISRDMLGRLLQNSTNARVDVCLADATMLPFRDASFDAAIAVHVLHLIPRWRDAVDQLMRVVKPGGKFLAERGGRAEGDWWHEVRRRFFAEAGDPPWPPGLDRIGQLDELMRDRGAAIRLLPELVDEGTPTANELLTALEAGIWSACWSLDEATRRRAAAVARSWAERNLGDLDEPRPVREVLTWRVYELP